MFFERDNIESDNFFKFDLVYKIKNNLELSSGLNIKRGNYNFNENFSPDPINIYSYPLLPESVTDSLGYFSDYNDFISVYPQYENEINNYVEISSSPFPGFINKQNGSLWKYFAYSQLKLKFKSLEITGGIRYDYIKVNNTSEFSPRFGLSYKLNPITKLNFAFGKYYQTPNYWKLLSPDNSKNLDNSYTEQFIIGLEHFIDDDMRFKVTKILIRSGWVHTKLIKDCETLDEQDIIKASILFIDVQGVGLAMGFHDEGLGLALAIKQKYPKKKVVIYSAETQGDRFHKALREADSFLAKNADPYEFQRLVEEFTIGGLS